MILIGRLVLLNWVKSLDRYEETIPLPEVSKCLTGTTKVDEKTQELYECIHGIWIYRGIVGDSNKG